MDTQRTPLSLIALVTVVIACALMALADVALAAERTPAVSVAMARQAAADVARNLGGGTVTRCIRHGRYFVKCRADLDTAVPCHVWAHVHAHDGAIYSPMPRFVSCGDRLLRL